MKKIIITQYRKEPSGSTFGAFTYHYGINFDGRYSYSVETTEEGMMQMIGAFKKGNEVEFVKKWQQIPISEPIPNASQLT